MQNFYKSISCQVSLKQRNGLFKSFSGDTLSITAIKRFYTDIHKLSCLKDIVQQEWHLHNIWLRAVYVCPCMCFWVQEIGCHSKHTRPLHISLQMCRNIAAKFTLELLTYTACWSLLRNSLGMQSTHTHARKLHSQRGKKPHINTMSFGQFG